MTVSDAPAYQPADVGQLGERAIVIGGGMAGLLSARVLADAFSDVRVLERDEFPDTPTPRPGVPQSNHVHVLLEAGRVGLERLLPGFESDVLDGGGVNIDAASDLQYFHRGDYLAEGPEELPMVCASRPLFEFEVRRRVDRIENITLEGDAGASNLTFSGDSVTGVELSGGGTPIRADLVVDATGRSSSTPRTLTEQGFARPRCDEVGIDLGYASVPIARPPDARAGYLIAPTPKNPRGGTVIPIEDDRWMVTLFGVHGTHPPGTREGFLAFAERLPVTAPMELLEQKTWRDDEIHQYPFPSNRWYRYDAIASLPNGLLVTGDAVASFNPIYGQGMSVAALDALNLHETLRTTSADRIGPEYFDRVAGTIGTIWRMTVGADFEFAETEGPRPMGTELFNWYLDRLVRAAHRDGVLANEFARVLRLEHGPAALLRPRVLRRVFWR